MPVLSFCTWCRDWPTIRQAMPINLALTAGQDVEFCVVDVGSSDDTVGWLRSLEDPRLRVVQAELQPLHFAQAYNLAHRMATADVLVTLDADNVVGPRYVSHVLDTIREDPLAVVHSWTGDWLDGTCGRLAYHRRLFEQCGGFDEQLGPIGFQDLDLRDRMQALGGHVLVCQDPRVVGLAIRTADGRKMQHIDGQYHTHNGANAARSQANLAARRLKANQE